MMKAITVLAIFLACACKEPSKEKTEKIVNINANFRIEILDNEALNIIDPKATIEVFASGFSWTEGPLWVEDGDFLLFSDVPNNKVYKLDSKRDTIMYLHHSGYVGENPPGKEPGSNGLLFNNEGNLVLLQHGDRRIVKMNAPLDSPAPNFITLINNYMGKKLNSPNDGRFDKEGNLYFTDPPYGLPLQEKDPAKELDFQGVYCLLNTGDLILIDKLTIPNGITLSPDESTLYVAVSDKNHAVWYQYDILEPGKVGNKKLFYDVTPFVGKEGEHGLPDGMKINSKGYLFATGPGGIWIFNSSGKVLARIYTGQLTSNCAFSTDEKRLFLTADDYILAVELK